MIQFNLRFLVVIVTLALGSWASVSGAEPICANLTECRTLKQKVDEQINFLLNNQTPKFLDVVVDESGDSISFTQSDAILYCAKLNAHLPSAREFAQFAKSMGAAGTLEVDYVWSSLQGKVPPGFSLVNATDSNGVPDVFYFNSQGLTVPKLAIEQNFFWSSSTNKNYQDGFYLYFGNAGKLAYGRNMTNAKASVRCVQN